MRRYLRIVAAVAVLTALAACAPDIDALLARAEQGDAESQTGLGLLYSIGLGVPEDHTEATRWYRLAADRGDASAQGHLGSMYDTGAGVPRDYVEAHMWANLATCQTSGEERDRWVKNRETVAAKMTPDQIADAERLAREWDAAHPREP